MKPRTIRSSSAGSWTLRVAALLVALGVLAGCSLLPATSSRSAGTGRTDSTGSVRVEEATPTPISMPAAIVKPTYTVSRGLVTRKLALNGRISPVTQQNLFFRVNGRVGQVHVRTGEMVKTGQLLAELENENAARDLAASQLDLEQAQARLKEAENALQDSIKRAQADLDIARENLAIVKVQDPTPRKTIAEVALQKADLARKQAQDAYDEIAWRNDRGASQQAAALQQATLNYTEAQADYELAVQAIAVHSHQVTIAQRQVDLAQLTLDGLKVGVDSRLVNDVDKAKLAVSKLQAAIDDTRIVAPFDGRVRVEFILAPGSPVNAFAYVATVSDLTSLEVRVDTVNLTQTPLSVGMPVTVALVQRPGVEVMGTVRAVPTSRMTTASEEDKALHIALEATGEPGDYQVDDLVHISILLEERPDVLWLPPAAIRTFEGREFVVLQEGAGQRRVDIKTGLESDDRIEITSGLTEGQIVVGQ